MYNVLPRLYDRCTMFCLNCMTDACFVLIVWPMYNVLSWSYGECIMFCPDCMTYAVDWMSEAITYLLTRTIYGVCARSFPLIINTIIIIIIYPLTKRVVGAPQMILQPVFSIFFRSPLPSGTCRTPSLSISWCCLLTSSFVRLVFFPLSLCLAGWLWPDLMNGKHDHTTAVCVFLRSSGDLHVVQLPAGSWHGLPRW